MGRTSKLTEKQWAEIEQRLLNDEPARQIAADYGINESAIRKRFGAQVKKIKQVANQLVAAETSCKKLPFQAQIKARTLAERLSSISEHLCGAAEYGAMTAHRLAGVAHNQIHQIDDAEPEKSREALQRISALTKLANDASELGVNLLKANKESIDRMNAPVEEDKAELLKEISSILPN